MWGNVMKKKIIYISGAEVFDIDDVRAAFEEVRSALKLSQDTILFGVPVDVENVCEQPVDTPILAEDCVVDEPECSDEDDCVCDTVEDETSDFVDESTEESTDSDDQTPEESDVVEEISEEILDTEPEQDITETDVLENNSETKSDFAAPILSVLMAKTNKESEQQDESIRETDMVAGDKEPDTVIVNTGIDNISEMINDDMPVTQTEKTLEELLESMTPLQEDVQAESEKMDEPEVPQAKTNEIDITLENLASEFAENQDKLVPQKKTSERGKIGKLKNILPFKKTKRDDSGIMGDLFGWAGVAANDDDFSMPGFFTNAK